MFKQNKRFITIVTVLVLLIILVPIVGMLWAKHETTTVTVSPNTTTTSQSVKKTAKKTTTTPSTKSSAVRDTSSTSPEKATNPWQTTSETSSSSSVVEETIPSSSQSNIPTTPNTPSNYYTADEAVAIVTAYYDRSGLSPTNVTFAVSDPTKVLVDQGNQYYWHVIGSVDGNPYMAYDVQLANGTIRESYLYGEGQATFVPAP